MSKRPAQAEQPVIIQPKMSAQAFVEKWRGVTLKESAAYSEHFCDLCRLIGHPTPAEMDPHGTFFTFQKGVIKNAAGAVVMEDTLYGAIPVAQKTKHGFADVWYKNHFAWEYKGKHKDLEKAREQLLQYIDDLQNPPLLVVSDIDRFEIHTRFNNCVKTVTRFSNEDLLKPESQQLVRNLFENVEAFKPTKTVQGVTEEVAAIFAKLAENLRSRSVDPHKVAHYLMKLLFCMFAEDVGILPNKIFQRLVEKAVGRFQGLGADWDKAADTLPLSRRKHGSPEDADFFSRNVSLLFTAMQKGGEFWGEQIDHFNGGLFDDDEAFDLPGEDLETLYYCARQDWSSIEPSIFGTLFERLLDPGKRSQLGAHYTSKEDIQTLVEPVLMQPLRRAWEKVHKRCYALLTKREQSSGKEWAKADKELRRTLEDFCHSLSLQRVLDPACGSGNFLYVSLNVLKELEKEVVTFAAKCGHSLFRYVGPEQLYGIELNSYAVELARLVVWIGHIQWDKQNGMYRPDQPILKPLKNIQERDAILIMPKEEGGPPAEPEWPECDVIVGNPPFLGGNRIRKELGADYVEHLFALYEGRVPAFADLCCYWFEKARSSITAKRCNRAGLLATQGIRGGANRAVLQAIKTSGDIFYGVSDRDWILDGANVHISIIAFDNGAERERVLDGRAVSSINANLTAVSDVTTCSILAANLNISFQGPSPKAKFHISEAKAFEFLHGFGNPSGLPNSDVVKPLTIAADITKRERANWTVDFAVMPLEQASLYQEPFRWLQEHVYPARSKNRRESYAKLWWQYAEARPGMRRAIASRRYIATPRHSKHRVFIWCEPFIICNDSTIVFAMTADCQFGVLHSRLHEVWALKLGTRLETRPRYTPTTCFETFPLPEPTKKQEQAIAQAAKELDDLRNAWLNPPEWTKEEVLTFPGSVDGAWARYVKEPNAKGIGTVHYPRIVPRDPECAKKLAKRTLTNLYNERPAWLDLVHKKLDQAVCAAYCFPADLPDEQVLDRLLKLNLARAEQTKH